MIYTILKFLILVLPLLIAVAYFTLVERKILASIQRRRGPNVIGRRGHTRQVLILFDILFDNKQTVQSVGGLKYFVRPVICRLDSNLYFFSQYTISYI